MFPTFLVTRNPFNNNNITLVSQDVGGFLLELVGHDSDLWIVAEALDAMFDVFGEDHLDPVVMEIGLVDKLKKILPVLKSKVCIY